MMQRVFDVENEKDMADLWDIVPDDANEIEKDGGGMFIYYKNEDCARCFVEVFNINWHDKTEIHRPIKEATKEDIGKICAFWENDWGYFVYAELAEILPERKSVYRYIAGHEKNGYEHCRRLTKQEIEELC